MVEYEKNLISLKMTKNPEIDLSVVKVYDLVVRTYLVLMLIGSADLRDERGDRISGRPDAAS